MPLRQHNQLVMMISTKWDFCIVCTIPSFLTKIIIVIIALVKTERECIRKIGRKVATLPKPTGLSQEQQRTSQWSRRYSEFLNRGPRKSNA